MEPLAGSGVAAHGDGKQGMPRSRKYWQDRAAEARAKADTMLSQVNRQIMLRISQSYERLAGIAAERENDKKDPEKGSW